MIIERPLETGQPRRIVYCLSNEITDNGDDTYSFVNLSDSSLGFGSKIHVIDSDMELFFDNSSGLLYPWLIKEDDD